MAYLKPQSPIKFQEDHIYPLTTADQVILEDGSRWDGGAEANEKIENAQSMASEALSKVDDALSVATAANKIATAAQSTVDGAISSSKSYTDSKITEYVGDSPVAEQIENVIGTHVGNTSNPHNVKPDQIGAAAEDHTHTPSSLGAAYAVHTHSGTGDNPYIHAAASSRGTQGYVKLASFNISSQYQNAPIELVISQRQKSTTASLQILFNGSADPGISYFYYRSIHDVEAYLHRTDVGCFDLYIKKTEGWDEIGVVDFMKPQYMNATSVTWKDEFAASIPDGAVQAQKYGVDSVNGKVGAFSLSYSDVGAAAASHNHAPLDIGTVALSRESTADTIYTTSSFWPRISINSNEKMTYSYSSSVKNTVWSNANLSFTVSGSTLYISTS